MILDTNALSAWADGDESIRQHLSSASSLVLPVIVLGEYLYGISQSRHSTRYNAWIEENLPNLTLAVIQHETAINYAEVRLELTRQGTPIPANDSWIAALALQHQMSILSNDRHFDRVKGIKRISWGSE